MVAHMSDEDLGSLNRGGHDPFKVYAAYHQAVNHKGQPTVILAKTVKGYATGEAGQAANTTHSLKKLDIESLKQFRDRFGIPISDEELPSVPYYRPEENSPEMRYLRERREALKGYIPYRKADFDKLDTPDLGLFSKQLESTGDREISSTMAFVRLLSNLAKDKSVGARVVPIVADEARTFGMEGMFRQLGIYAPEGQKYEPEDSDQIMFYKESESGQILEEGINEAGAFSSWLACATSYSHSDYPMIPFYIYYSMFGFQRIGDLAWAAGDLQARGFLIGATAGRTTLNGEGLQHQDGHSHLVGSSIPNCRCYDPTYSFELAVIIQDGVRRMYGEGENCFYYISTMNENYQHPELPEGAEEGIVRGMYLLKKGAESSSDRVQLMGGGSILVEVEKAAEMLKNDWGVEADVWSMTSVNEVYRDAKSADRWNLLHPEKPAKVPYITKLLSGMEGPKVIATDYIHAYAEQLRSFIPGTFTVLGTDGFGRSDTREKLRDHFEVDSRYICVAALSSLVKDGKVEKSKVVDAMNKYGIDPEKSDPISL